jgi:hypothetical protein
VIVNSITYVNSSTVTLNLNTTGCSGDFLIRITNPDGQQMTSATPILNVDPALPIQLASFTGSVVGQGTVRLDWVTLSEVNNYGFEVQRSYTAPTTFVTVPNGFVPGHGTTIEPQYYSFTDRNVLPQVVYYRLKQIDLDGTTHYYDPIRIDMLTSVPAQSTPTFFSLEQGYRIRSTRRP